jgi:superfamily II DNA or RNA helicase
MTAQKFQDAYASLTDCQKAIVDVCILSVNTTYTSGLTEKVAILASKYNKATIDKERKFIPKQLVVGNSWSIEAHIDVIVARYTDTYHKYPSEKIETLNKNVRKDVSWNGLRTTLRELLEAAITNNRATLEYRMRFPAIPRTEEPKLVELLIHYEQALMALSYFNCKVVKEALQLAVCHHMTQLAPTSELTAKLRRIAAEAPSKEVTEAALEAELLEYLMGGLLDKAQHLIEQHASLAKSSYAPFVWHYQASSLLNQGALEKLGKTWLVKKEGRFSRQPILLKHLFTLSLTQQAAANAPTMDKLSSYLYEYYSASDAPFQGMLYKTLNQQEHVKEYTNRLKASTVEEVTPNTLLSVCLGAFYLGVSLPASTLDRALQVIALLQTNGYHTLALEVTYIATELLPENANLQQLLASQEQTLGFKPLAMQHVQKQDWEYTLDQLLSAAPSPTEGQQATSDARIIYLVNVKYDRVTPILQKMGKGGAWSKGRNIALKRLKSEEVEGMTPLDSRIAATIKKTYGYHADEYVFDDDKLWKELIGHPLLFDEDAPDIPIELVERKPVLIVTKKGKDYTLAFDIKPTPNQKYQLVKETSTRYAYVEQDERHLRIGNALGSGKLKIPSAGESQLKELIARLSGTIEIHSDFTNQNVEQHPADSSLRILMMPVGDSLKAEILVKPAGDKPPYCHPGKGIGFINTTNEQNVNIQVVRDMGQERKNADALAQAISHLDFDMDDDFTMHFTEPSECLALLEVLQQQSELCKVEWPEGVQYRLRRQVGMGNFNIGITQKGQWFDIEGSLQVDEQTVVSLQDLMKMRRTSNRRFVEMGDGDFIALSEALRKRLDEIESAFIDSKSSRVSTFALPAIIEEPEEYGSFKASAKVIDFKKRIEKADKMAIAIPKMLEAELRPYQTDGFRWLAKLSEWGAGACLADDMGLGKTVQAIALLLHHAPQGASLVVCPASVLPNWVSELRRFAPSLTPVTLNSSNREETVKGALAFDVMVTTYGLLQSEEALFQSVEWNGIIFDEAHILKNHQTKTHKAANNLKAKSRVALTGTPLQNHLGELWSIFNLLNPGLLGNLNTFNETFAIPISQNPEAYQRGILKRRITPFLLRRTKSTVLDELPAKTEITLTVTLSPDEMAFYEAIRREAVENITNTEEAGQKHLRALAELTRLRLACCNTQLVSAEVDLPSSKIEAFAALVEELIENNHRALVFSQFTKHLNLIQTKLREMGISYQYLDGSTPIPERGELVKAFQQGNDPLFLISLKAGGLGLNLTAADYVIHLDPWWNPAIEDQATDRAHRMGQQRPVTVYRLVAEGTIEEKIVRLHQTKRELAEGLLEGTDSSAKLSAEEMLQLLM